MIKVIIRHTYKSFLIGLLQDGLIYNISVHADQDWTQTVLGLVRAKLVTAPAGLEVGQYRALAAYYQQPGSSLLWSGQNGRLLRAVEFRQLLQRVEAHGLDRDPYRFERIESYWYNTDIDSVVALELLLSQVLLEYASDIHSGRYHPYEMDEDWFMDVPKLDFAQFLLDISGQTSINEFLHQLAPIHKIYREMQNYLGRYLSLAELGGWTAIEKGPTLRPGMQHAHVVQVRQRLVATGDLTDTTQLNSSFYDEALITAVKHYQKRNGLKTDGLIGKDTRAAMNVPVDQRIGQIRLNLERWRWLPLEFKGHSLVVNMTGYMLYGVRDQDIVMEMPVIIGKAYRSTPSINNKMSYIEMNPYWNVPTSIALKDLIPRQMRDPEYLGNKNIRVFRGWHADAEELDPAEVDWSRVNKNYFPYRLRQDPGPDNSLGRIKFMFPNEYSIYLHDTPNRELFNQNDRAFSSGCIRVQDPMFLATYLLGDTSEAGQARIESLLATGETQALLLSEKIPIYLVYMTAWVDRAGYLNFRRDIYGRDQRMLNRICQKRPEKCDEV